MMESGTRGGPGFSPGQERGGLGGPVSGPPYDIVATIVAVAERDDSIARVLREICALDGAVRSGALDLVGGYLRSAGRDVVDCLEALRRDEVARRIAEKLGPPG
jgi:hypothetical protein